MSSVMPFAFNAEELCVVTINEKPWTRAREVCKAVRYEKKTANIVKSYYSKENYNQKYQMSSVPAAGTPVDWPKDSQKFEIFTSMKKGCISCYFQANSQRQKHSESIVAMCCFLMFGNSLETKYKKNINKPSHLVTIKYKLLSLKMRSINRKL